MPILSDDKIGLFLAILCSNRLLNRKRHLWYIHILKGTLRMPSMKLSLSRFLSLSISLTLLTHTHTHPHTQMSLPSTAPANQCDYSVKVFRQENVFLESIFVNIQWKRIEPKKIKWNEGWMTIKIFVSRRLCCKNTHWKLQAKQFMTLLIVLPIGIQQHWKHWREVQN